MISITCLGKRFLFPVASPGAHHALCAETASPPQASFCPAKVPPAPHGPSPGRPVSPPKSHLKPNRVIFGLLLALALLLSSMPVQADPSPPAAPNQASSPPARQDSPPARENLSLRVLTLARNSLGTPYRGGGSLRTGRATDCSGLVQRIFKHCHIDLPRSSAEQARLGKVVAHRTMDFARLQVGDLLFFRRGGLHIGHVGIYVGEGKMIHATTRRRGVALSDLRQAYYQDTFVVAKRLFEEKSSP